MSQLNFDVNSVEAAEGFPDALPAGWYPVIMTSSNLRTNANGVGSSLHTAYKIIEGENSGKFIFIRVNWEAVSEQAQQIGRGKIAAVAKALNINGILQDSNQLHDKPFMLKVNYQEPNGNFAAQNDIGAAKPMDASQQVSQYQAPAQSVQVPVQQAPVATAPVTVSAPAQVPPVKFDPNTGQPIAPAPVQTQAQQFDPNTGQPISQPPVLQVVAQPQHGQNFTPAEIADSQDKPVW